MEKTHITVRVNKVRSSQMLESKQREFWFVVGSQHLYGEDTLNSVREHAEEMAQSINDHLDLPYPVIFKDVVKTADEIKELMKEVNYQDQVAGVITLMHTFSSAKICIHSMKLLENTCLI